MTVHLQRQIDKLKQVILSLGSQVETAVTHAIRAVENRDPGLARTVIEQDNEIDQVELDVEEECLHTLALHQPVAFDLRYVVAVLKINNDLERIGDLAVNIAEQAVFLSRESPVAAMPYDLPRMARHVRSMLKGSLDALVEVDAARAEGVREEDDKVDEIHREMYERVEAAVRADPGQAPQLIHLMNISRQLERIADLTVNVAEDVIYMARGEVLRHGGPRPGDGQGA